MTKDDFEEDELLLDTPTIDELNTTDSNTKPTLISDYVDVASLDDDEFDRLLNEFVQDDDTNELSFSDDDVLDERQQFELEKQLIMEKLRIEREELECEKRKFARYKSEWESLKKLSEESFQAEKEEYEKQRKLDKEKMYLETQEIVNSCANFREFLDNYNKIRDVSE